MPLEPLMSGKLPWQTEQQVAVSCRDVRYPHWQLQPEPLFFSAHSLTRLDEVTILCTSLCQR